LKLQSVNAVLAATDTDPAAHWLAAGCRDSPYVRASGLGEPLAFGDVTSVVDRLLPCILT